MFARLAVLISIAFRNLSTSWLNLLVGLLILVGTLLVVVGSAMLDSLDHSMNQSIVGSVAGDVQVYSAGKDDLALFGDFGGVDVELPPLTDIAKVEAALRTVPNVKHVVPMGIRGAFLTSGNTVDLILSRLRDAVRAQLEGDKSPELAERSSSLKAHVQHIVRILQTDFKNRGELLVEQATEQRDADSIERAASPEFWASFDEKPLDGLEFLENRIAPLLTDGDLIYIRYIGTDLDLFQRTFDRMRIVAGQQVPTGHRGFLFAKWAYEEHFKLKTARRLDKLQVALETNNRKIADDDELKRLVRENLAQTREIVLQLDPQRTQEAIRRLQRALGSKETTLEPLLHQLLDVNDQNFHQHYAIFYEQLGKDLLELYRVRVGDSLTINAYTRSGYMQAVNVKVYGVFEFVGLEKSPLGGVSHLMDLVTFRELYGYLSAERAEEIKKLKASTGAQDLGRDEAEQALFGTARPLTDTAHSGTIDENALLGDSKPVRRGSDDRTFDPEELHHGVALNAAVMLKDVDRLQETLPQMRDAAKAAGLSLKVIPGPEAAGVIGQFVRLARLALYIFAFIIFLVTVVVINNAMMMATLQRIREIGTLRALGAQRGFVLSMVCAETSMLGLIFGGLGLALGSGFMLFLHAHGIGAFSDETYFFFSGPRLYPGLSPMNLALAFAIVLTVSLISTLYPALIATRISPLRAMQTDE
jgi:ABC-type lipoprotein release transport system permease subunit